MRVEEIRWREADRSVVGASPRPLMRPRAIATTVDRRIHDLREALTALA
jgi:hypothetical protein